MTDNELERWQKRMDKLAAEERAKIEAEELEKAEQLQREYLRRTGRTEMKS